MITTVLLLALGIFSVSNLIRLCLPVQLTSAAKSLIPAALSALVAAWFSESGQGYVLVAGGVFGSATILHVVHKLLGAAGDDRRTAVIARVRR